MASRHIVVADSFTRERVTSAKRPWDDFSRAALEYVSVAMGIIGLVMFVDAMSGGGLRSLCGRLATLLR